MSDLSMSAGANVAQGFADEAQWQLHNYQNNRQETTMQKNAFDYQTKLNNQMREQRLLSKSDEVSALKMAGLSPALAAGAGGFASAGSGGSVSGGHTPMQHVAFPSMLEAIQVGSNVKMQNAQADLIQNEAHIKAEEYRRMRDESDTFNALLVDWADRIIKDKDASPDDKATAEFILGSNEAYSMGTLKGIEAWRDFALHNSQRANQIVQNSFEKAVTLLKEKNGAAKLLARMPEKEFSKISKQVSDLIEDVYLKRAQRALTLVDVEKAGAEFKKIMQDALKTYHSDPAAMLDNGDWKALGVYTFQSVLQAAEGAVAGRFAAGGIPHSDPPKQSVGKDDHRTETRTRYNKKGEKIGSETITRMGQLYDIFNNPEE